MKRAETSKGRKSSKKASSAQKKALKQVDLAVVGGQITNLVGNSAVEMVQITMDEVKKGHYLAMKYLFEMIGLCPATTPEGPLARRLVSENPFATVKDFPRRRIRVLKLRKSVSRTR